MQISIVFLYVWPAEKDIEQFSLEQHKCRKTSIPLLLAACHMQSITTKYTLWANFLSTFHISTVSTSFCVYCHIHTRNLNIELESFMSLEYQFNNIALIKMVFVCFEKYVTKDTKVKSLLLSVSPIESGAPNNIGTVGTLSGNWNAIKCIVSVVCFFLSELNKKMKSHTHWWGKHDENVFMDEFFARIFSYCCIVVNVRWV